MPEPASAPRFDTYLTAHETAEVRGVSASAFRNRDRSAKPTAIRDPADGYLLNSRNELDFLIGQAAETGVGRSDA